MILSPNERTEILRAIKKRVLTKHVNVADVDYNAWAKRFEAKLPELLTVEMDTFEDGVRKLLLELGSSHTAFYHEHPNRLLPQHTINATLQTFPLSGDNRWIFLDVFEGGPAHAAGIKGGDALLAVNGVSSGPPSMPVFKTGQTYTLAVSDAQGENARDIVVEVPKRKGTKERPPIVEPKGPWHEMIAPSIGLFRIAYFPGAVGMRLTKELDRAFTDLKQHGCDRLIIDLRGNIGGSLGFAMLASYMCPGKVAIGNSLTPQRLRTGYDRNMLPRVPMPRTKPELLLTLARFSFRDKSVVLLTQGLGEQPFHKNIVVLVNEFTNSAAEMVASFAAENGLATIVGRKTAGNVLGAANFKVGSGYWLRLPIFGWCTSQGECVEGKGVSPDVVVDVDPRLLNAGVDEQMNKAIEILNSR